MNKKFLKLVKKLKLENVSTDKDITIHYFVNKKLNTAKTKLQDIINLVIAYVQNNEIYFDYTPTFWNGVLIFGIVGTKKEQDKFNITIGKVITKLGGKLNISLKKEK